MRARDLDNAYPVWYANRQGFGEQLRFVILAQPFFQGQEQE
jgi:hypothetical protein